MPRIEIEKIPAQQIASYPREFAAVISGREKQRIGDAAGLIGTRPLPATRCHRVIVAIESHQGALYMQISTIGLDIAKNVFQVHGIDAAEKVVVRKRLRRRQVLEFFKALPRCLIGMEACATAHYWARELTKLGHQVRLMPAKDVKAYVKRNKNDAADAEAICEAVRRPTMRFVRIKSAEQQGQLMQHRTRDVLIRQRTQIINALRRIWPSSGWWRRRATPGSTNCARS